MLFFVNLNVDGQDFQTVQWGKIMVDQQRLDFQGVSPMLAWVAGGPKPTKTKAWLQKSRGYSKTTDIAAMLAYLLVFAQKQLSIDIIADDEAQAKLVLTQLRKLLSHNAWLGERINAQRNKVVCKTNGTVAEFIARDPSSAYGRTPDITIMDELTHWRSESMWTAGFSSYQKRGGPLIIACNAGYGTGWQWNIRCMAEEGKDWYFSAPHGPAPWRTEAELKEQEKGMLAGEYRRLWWNEWQSSTGAFLTLEEANGCVDYGLRRTVEAPHDGLTYVASIDYAEKHDRTACTLGHLENGRVVIDRMDVFDPRFQPGGIVLVQAVDEWIWQIEEAFHKRTGRVLYLVDPWGMQSIIQSWSTRVDIVPIEFHSSKHVCHMSQVLRHLVLHKRVAWYPGCGTIYTEDGSPFLQNGRPEDLCVELSELITKTKGEHWRFDHMPNKHDDRATSLAALCTAIVDDTEGSVEWGITPPTEDGRFRI